MVNKMLKKRFSQPTQTDQGVAGEPDKSLLDHTLHIAPAKQNAAIARDGKLLVLSGALQGREFVLNKDRSFIGSHPDNDVVLNDPTVSRRHCEIRFTPTEPP